MPFGLQRKQGKHSYAARLLASGVSSYEPELVLRVLFILRKRVPYLPNFSLSRYREQSYNTIISLENRTCL
jgi:hypothetical protein